MVSALGHSFIQKVKEFLYMTGYLGKLIAASFLFAQRGKTARKILTMQLLFTYVEALPICCFLAAGKSGESYQSDDGGRKAGSRNATCKNGAGQS